MEKKETNKTAYEILIKYDGNSQTEIIKAMHEFSASQNQANLKRIEELETISKTQGVLIDKMEDVAERYRSRITEQDTEIIKKEDILMKIANGERYSINEVINSLTK